MMIVKSTTRSYLMINCFLIFLLTDMLKEDKTGEKKEPGIFFSNDNDIDACRVYLFYRREEILSFTDVI